MLNRKDPDREPSDSATGIRELAMEILNALFNGYIDMIRP